MKEFDNIKDLIYCELDEISRQNKLDMNTVKIIGEFVDILKDIGSIEMFEEGVQIQDENYSYGRNQGYSQRRMPVYYDINNGGYQIGQNSGYSRRGNRGGYSMEDGKSHIINQLYNIMNEANDAHDRDAIQRLIEQMEK